MKIVQALKIRNSDSEKSLFRKTLDEGRETWNEMPLVTLEREDHLTASRPHIEISEKRATFCKASYEICFPRRFLLLLRGLKPKKYHKNNRLDNLVNQYRSM